MGKAARWFRLFLGLKQPDPTNPNPKPKDKRRWSFVKSYREKHPTKPTPPPPPPPPPPPTSSSSHPHDVTTSATAYVGEAGDAEASKHAIAVAAATAAVAEAAVAAAQAAAAVVRLTHGGGGQGHAGRSEGGGLRELQVRAAVVIQSYFRGYLARRALRALKGLVKLQALVRGHIMRKKTAETMRCMQAMLRAQARARCVRAYLPESPNSSSKSCQLLQHPGPPTPEKYEQILRAKASKQDQPPPNIRRNLSRPSSTRGHLTSSSWSDPQMDNEPMWDPRGCATSSRTCMTDDADRILEIDPGKPPFTLRRKAHSSDTTTSSATHHHLPHLSTTTFSGEVVQSLLNPLKFHHHHHETDNEDLYCTAENSPHCHSAAASQGGSSRRGGGGPFTPTKSDGSRSFLSGYSDCPSYMADTESSRAKMRSMSAPKQRPHYYERVGSTRSRYSVHGGLGGDYHNHPPRSNPQRAAAMHASFASKAYPGSGRLDRLGMPVRDSTVVYYSGYLN